MKQKDQTIGRTIGVLSAMIAAVGLSQQLRQPRAERTWHGHVAGIPYDFRVPTPSRARDTLWQPSNSSLLVPTLFGVGWTLNLYRLVHPLQPDAR